MDNGNRYLTRDFGLILSLNMDYGPEKARDDNGSDP